jgi:hypothetical protein
MTSSRVACLLITICLLVNPAKALPIPHSIKHTSFVGASHVELAVLSIFTTGKRSPTIPYMASVSSRTPPPSLAAIIVSILWAFFLSVMTEARAMAVLRDLRRTSAYPSILYLARPSDTRRHRRCDVSLASTPHFFSLRCIRWCWPSYGLATTHASAQGRTCLPDVSISPLVSAPTVPRASCLIRSPLRICPILCLPDYLLFLVILLIHLMMTILIGSVSFAQCAIFCLSIFTLIIHRALLVLSSPHIHPHTSRNVLLHCISLTHFIPANATYDALEQHSRIGSCKVVVSR